jgi:uncharacterized lipoprotein YddW (UPF0748 family)
MIPRRCALAALVLCVAAASAHAPLRSDDASEVRALWVDSFNPGLRGPAEIDDLIARAKQANLNTIVAQIRRNAQGLYALSPEGWVENYAPPAGFDPLQALIDKAHVEGIEVHAWANIGPIFSGNPNVATASFPCKVPCNPSHIFNLHGWGTTGEANWLTRAHPSFLSGTTFSGYRQSPSGLWFMDLGHPAAAEHTMQVLVEIVRNYDVDGIHLDYIRYPEMPIASPRPPGVGLPFSIGYNETSVDRFNAAYARPDGSLPNPWDASFSDWRREQVRAFVRRLYLEMNFVRPSAKLSAALITFFRGPNTSEPRTFQQTEPYYRVFQDWGGWMQEGILDVSIPMIYKSQHIASHVTQFNEWIEFTKNSQYARHGIHGLGAFMNSLENTVFQIGRGRSPSAVGATSRGFNFFSYNATNLAVPGTPLRPRDEFFRALSVDGAYAEIAPFPHPVAVPPMGWKTDPRLGHLLAQVLDANGRPADGALVRIQKMGAGPRDEPITQHADGNGYVGGVDLQPGAYQLVVEIPGAADRITVPQPVVPGRVTRLVFNLSQPSRGPMVRAERALGAHERTDHLPQEASDLAEWIVREPVPEDLRKPGSEPQQ